MWIATSWSPFALPGLMAAIMSCMPLIGVVVLYSLESFLHASNPLNPLVCSIWRGSERPVAPRLLSCEALHSLVVLLVDTLRLSRGPAPLVVQHRLHRGLLLLHIAAKKSRICAMSACNLGDAIECEHSTTQLRYHESAICAQQMFFLSQTLRRHVTS